MSYRMSINLVKSIDEFDPYPDLPEQHAFLNHDDFPFILPIAEPGDSLEGGARKLYGRADAIRVVELAQCEDWKQQKLQLPSIDWDRNYINVSQGRMKTCCQRATDIDIIWNFKGATPENAACISSNRPSVLPLVRAVQKLSITFARLPDKVNSNLSETESL
ncbi:hypothetical protein N7520_008341 [Penicillium odoratum]|uniref:uncharacterized protein n=1 Tax=Penicillium odoratum TaxID=1167516 RepID=UPI00254787BC|nr:uncharacterized protein N7520_008341 [Penicillium odoratum]KAJ5761185.1 hypothetical protein N7520_008341 [Penicillium odoratum]